ncbi:hypothetical protein V9K67_21295 [Paraflavisolibacter sp. H34]|uniref:hypothetical protein n=1 Tax=Huijunlia imazamoxiresistens TaxID=3127457 RepID=UPI003019E7D2
MIWITSTDLAGWAPQRDCEEHFPLLIRRLIVASPVQLTWMQFPAGDNVALPGFDGYLEALSATPYIPEGKSVWEIGTGKDYRDKANGDYQKRAEKPLYMDPMDTTFVFVTRHVWREKESWVAERLAEGKWKNVKVIDGLMLEEWLDTCPSVSAWLAKYLHKYGEDMEALSDFWENWSQNPQHKIAPKLVTSGREKEMDELKRFLSAAPAQLTVKATTTEEALAFIAAAVEQMEGEHKESIHARSVIVESEQSLRKLIPSITHMVIIYKGEDAGLGMKVTKSGHHVLLPLGNEVTSNRKGIHLPRIRRSGFESGLKDMGFGNEEALRLTRDSGQSLSVLRRRLNFSEGQQPQWAKNGPHQHLLPALFAGVWIDQSEGDRSLLELLSAEPYDRYISKLAGWKIDKDPPVMQVGHVWRMTSALDALSMLAPFITKDDLNRFREAFLLGLGEIDPRLELEPSLRHMAGINQKSPRFSPAIKEGLCQSLVLMAVFGESFDLQAHPFPQGFADSLVQELLKEATGDKWCSLQTHIPLIAEAAPTSFLSAVEQSLERDHPPIMKMFEEAPGLLSPHAYHTGLLWALEGLAYSSEYLHRVILILGKLSRLDPGGRLSNRPARSLKEILIAWISQVDADYSLRQTILSRLIQREPEVAWTLLLSLSPKYHGFPSSINKCRWRFNSQDIERQVSAKEIEDYRSFIFDQLLALAQGSEERLGVLVDLLPKVPAAARQKLVQLLVGNRNNIETEGIGIWNALRQLIGKHRRFVEQHWALPSTELEKLEEVLKLYAPVDSKRSFAYLFEGDQIYDSDLADYMDFKEREKALKSKRLNALRMIYEEEGWEGLMFLIHKPVKPNLLGYTAAGLFDSAAEDTELLRLFSESVEGEAFTQFFGSYCFYKSLQAGKEWSIGMATRMNQLQLDSAQQARFFLALVSDRPCWQLVEEAGPEVGKIYWSRMPPNFFSLDQADAGYLIEKLRVYKRQRAAIEQVADFVENVPSSALAELLREAATVPTEEDVQLDRIGEIIQILQERRDLDKQTLAQLEWFYLDFLSCYSSEYRPVTLFEELKTNPTFFVEVVSLLYKPDDRETDSALTEEERRQKAILAIQAKRLLDSWRDVPGAQPDITIKKGELFEWVAQARKAAAELKRVYGVDSRLGKLLAFFPRNNSRWPPDEICELIDSLDSKVVQREFGTQIFNNRGLYIKDPHEGGAQERELASYFERMGKQILSKWPVTASILFDLAKGYTEDAKREDDSAHLDELI